MAEREPAFQQIIFEKKDWVATVTINRPEVYNAFSRAARKDCRPNSAFAVSAARRWGRLNHR